jgi:predicted nucleic acid-binding protein
LIYLDTNVISEIMRHTPDPSVERWLVANESEAFISSVALAEIAYGIEKVRPHEKSPRLAGAFELIRRRYAGRIHGVDENCALIYGRIMGEAKKRGRTMSPPDGMIAAIALIRDAALATRNVSHFDVPDLRLIDPWR